MAAIAIDLQDDDEDESMLCLLKYQSKTCMVRVLLTIEFFFMTIFPEQRVPHHLCHHAN